MSTSKVDPAVAFARYIERRGGWLSAETLAFALDAVACGYAPARALELALATRYERPVKKVPAR